MRRRMSALLDFLELLVVDEERADVGDRSDVLVALLDAAEAGADERRDDQGDGDEPGLVDRLSDADAGGLVGDVDGHRSGVDHHHGPDAGQQADDGADERCDPAGTDCHPVVGVDRLKADVACVDLVDDGARRCQIVGETLARHPRESLRELRVVDDVAEDGVLHVCRGADQADDQSDQVLQVAATNLVEFLVGAGREAGGHVDRFGKWGFVRHVGGHCLCAPCWVADGMCVQPPMASGCTSC